MRRVTILALALALPGALAPAPAQADAAPAAPARCLTAGLGGTAWVAASAPGVRIWARRARAADVRRAKALVALYRARIGPRFTTLLGRSPVGDGRVACPHGKDARLDVYLSPNGAYAGGSKRLPAGTAAAYIPYSGKPCDPRKPGFVVARTSVDGWILAHEAYHAYQAAFPRLRPCIFYSEWDEATATWAGDDAFPAIRRVRDHIGALRDPRLFITAPDGYRAWVVPYLAARRYGRQVLRRLELTAGTTRENDHVGAALPQGLRGFWPAFALQMWNQAPLPGVTLLGAEGKGLRELKGIATAPTRPPRTLALPDALTYQDVVADALEGVPGGPSTVNALGRDYRRYLISDARVRRVRIRPGLTGGVPVVAALVRTAAGWRSEDWTGRDVITFCRDEDAEDVRELVVAFGNVATDAGTGTAEGVPEIELTAACAYPATITGTVEGSVSGGSSTISWNGTLTYSHQATDPVTGFPYTGDVRYRITGGAISWHVTGSCTGGGTLTDAQLVDAFSDGQLELEETAGKGYGYELSAAPLAGTQMLAPCSGGGTLDAAQQVGTIEGALLYTTDSRGPETNRFSDLETFAGALDITPGLRQTWAWDMHGTGEVPAPSGFSGG